MRICNDQQKVGALKLAPLKQPPFLHSVSGKESMNTDTTRVSMHDTDCVGCGQCITNCVPGAITPADAISDMQVAMEQGKTMVAMLAPATRIGIAEGMGMPIGQSAEAQTIDALRKIGFHYVFDMLWAADLCVLEDAKEIVAARRSGNGPIFTSCCSGWISLAEIRYPSVIPQISTARSPSGIMASVVKRKFSQMIDKSPEDVFTVGMMPCTSKKVEAKFPNLYVDGMPETDASVTTRELLQMFKDAGMEFTKEKEAVLLAQGNTKADAPFSSASGSAYLFGLSGGVTEAVVRHVFKLYGIKFNSSLIRTKLLWESPNKL